MINLDTLEPSLVLYAKLCVCCRSVSSW